MKYASYHFMYGARGTRADLLVNKSGTMARHWEEMKPESCASGGSFH